MIKEITSNFSEGELAELIGATYIDSYQEITGEQLTNGKLADAANILFGLDMILDGQSRRRLVERMSKSQVDRFLTDTLDALEYNDVLEAGVDKYDLLASLSDKFPKEFGAALGLAESLSFVEESSLPVQGIRVCRPVYPLYPYQRDISEKARKLISSRDVKRCLIHLPTGAGKTRTAMNIICDHLRENEDALVLWLADTSELCAQAMTEFDKAWQSLGNRELTAYSFFSDANITLGGIDRGFLVAGLQKLNSAKKGELSILYRKLSEFVTLVVFDEAHKAIAPTYARAVSDMLDNDKHQSSFLLGLSATPGRKIISGLETSEEDRDLAEFFGKNKITMNVPGYPSPIKYLVDNGYLAKANFFTISYEGGKILFADEFSSSKHENEIKKALTEDQNRNLKLLETIRAEYLKGSSIIVFACSVEHSVNLSRFLSFEGIRAYSLDSINDNSETRRLKIAEYSSGKVKILINYGILAAGFDAPITNVAVVARPTDSLVQYSQMVGRAMRGKKSGGNEECNIYTVRDDIPAFTSVLRAFSHWDELWSER